MLLCCCIAREPVSQFKFAAKQLLLLRKLLRYDCKPTQLCCARWRWRAGPWTPLLASSWTATMTGKFHAY